MADVTIKKGSVTFTFDDGDVEDVVIGKTGNLDENPIPASDSDSAFVLDFNGVIKAITITGSLTNSSSSRTDVGTTQTIAEQIDWLLALVDGVQDGHTFNSTFQTDKTVYCRKVNFTEKSGSPNESPFTIELVEGI